MRSTRSSRHGLRSFCLRSIENRYEDVQPVSMGSAGLKFASDGRVAWDEMWGLFCDLALAGGPPHRGRVAGIGIEG